jgi:hypothetical protein
MISKIFTKVILLLLAAPLEVQAVTASTLQDFNNSLHNLSVLIKIPKTFVLPKEVVVVQDIANNLDKPLIVLFRILQPTGESYTVPTHSTIPSHTISRNINIELNKKKGKWDTIVLETAEREPSYDYTPSGRNRIVSIAITSGGELEKFYTPLPADYKLK